VFLNFLKFDDLSLNVKEFRLSKESSLSMQIIEQDIVSGLTIPEVTAQIAEFYKKDLLNNGKIAVLKSFKPVKVLTRTVGSLLGPIYQPLV